MEGCWVCSLRPQPLPQWPPDPLSDALPDAWSEGELALFADD